MGTEESRETKVSSFEEVIQKTRELTALLKEDERYQEYCRSLERLKSRPELYKNSTGSGERIWNCRYRMTRRTMTTGRRSCKKQYKNILMESVVMDFLRSEQAVCKLLREVYEVLYGEIALDISYMDEE